MAEGKSRDRSVWGVVWYGGLGLAGLVVVAVAFARLPPSRGNLVVAEAAAPVHVTDELVRVSSGRRGSATYRQQNIAVSGGGRGYLLVSPPRELWVPEIDRLPRGTVVRFLIDVDNRLIYEARLGERILLAYETSAGQLRGGALTGLGFGALMLAVGGFGLWRRREIFTVSSAARDTGLRQRS